MCIACMCVGLGVCGSLEIEVEAGMAVLALCNDDSTGIEMLSKRITEARPDQAETVFSTLVCLPGLFSNNPSRITTALDGEIVNHRDLG